MHYKFIDLPNLKEIQERILRNLPQDLKTRTLYITLPTNVFETCVPLVHAVETIKPWSEIDNIGLVVVMPNGKIPIHTDIGKIIDTKYSLNIPIYNCERPYTAFYRSLIEVQGDVYVQQPHGDSLIRYDESVMQEIARMHLYKSAIFNTQVPHGITNPTDEPRIVVSIRFLTPFDLSNFN
jgi:hypothetical protein